MATKTRRLADLTVPRTPIDKLERRNGQIGGRRGFCGHPDGSEARRGAEDRGWRRAGAGRGDDGACCCGSGALEGGSSGGGTPADRAAEELAGAGGGGAAAGGRVRLSAGGDASEVEAAVGLADDPPVGQGEIRITVIVAEPDAGVVGEAAGVVAADGGLERGQTGGAGIARRSARNSALPMPAPVTPMRT